ncbi:Peroxidase 69 [Frankliniella fusca]|uniref:Peroxidase 69 n=1 Tax=Frankliniella fusca TaxID=407009 RepID=A0AAE1LHX3_9NEOP|nr:Peroxidase 69 [Frankliniella fusca]
MDNEANYKKANQANFSYSSRCQITERILEEVVQCNVRCVPAATSDVRIDLQIIVEVVRRPFRGSRVIH